MSGSAKGWRRHFTSCAGSRDAKRGLYGLALWIFSETSAVIVRENPTPISQLGRGESSLLSGCAGALVGSRR
jgi:hypothetical protein